MKKYPIVEDTLCGTVENLGFPIDQRRAKNRGKSLIVQMKCPQHGKRPSDLEIIVRKLYEDCALGHIDLELCNKMFTDYEAETERLKLKIEAMEKRVEQQEMNDDLEAFIVLTEKYVDVTELTQTIVNEYIKKILVYTPDKSSGNSASRFSSASWMKLIFLFYPEKL